MRPEISLHFVTVICIFLVIESSEIVFPCETPNNEKAFCQSLFSCPILLKSLGSLQPSAIKFVKQSICANSCGSDDLVVCCGTKGNYDGIEENIINSSIHPLDVTTQPSTETNVKIESNINLPTTTPGNVMASNESHRDFVIRKLLPSTRFCGLQHTDDRVYSESETALDEFPWLVHVLFGNDTLDKNYVEDPLEYIDRCNGVLITNRYVLTNAYCAREPAGRIRLGQYNTNKTVSCVPNSQVEECTEPVKEVFVEKLILMVDMTYGWYDFALIRLATKLQYSDFIRPICLPLNRKFEGDTLTLSGWGASVQSGVAKKRLNYKLTNVEECYKGNEDIKELAANSSYICLTPKEQINDSVCTGDEGGALMYTHRHQWFADAIISRVLYDTNSDSVCTNVRPVDAIRITPKVIDWILDTIEP